MKKFAYPLGVTFFWIIAFSYIFKSSVPIVSNTSFKNKATVFNFIPQGWGFFTRDAREEELILYELKNDTILRFTKTNSDVSSFFGASRKSRLIGVESGILVSKIKDTLWKPMKGNQLILDKEMFTDTIINSFTPCHIKGDFFFVLQERTPWAWAGHKIIMPYKYIKVYVTPN